MASSHFDFSLSEPSGYVILRLFFVRICEDFRRLVVFYQLSEIKECGLIAYAGCLLHVVGYDDDRVVFLYFMYQLFHLGG